MELFSLLAKLTLDSKEFEKGISEAQSAGKDINITDPELGLDKSEFDAGIEEAENTDVENPDDPELGLDKEDFDSGIEDAESTEVEDPEAPSLGLDTSEFNDNLNEGEANAGMFGESLGSIFKDLSGILTATGIVAAVAGIVGSLKEGVELAKNTGDAIHKQSAFMKLSTKSYQEWDYALQLSGASITDLTRGMRNFDQIMAGNPTKDQEDALGRLKINMDEVTDAEDLMTKSMYALADYTGSDKDWIAKQLFGNNYTKFARLLEGGSEGIKAMREEAEGLGFVMTDEEIQNAADYMDATTRLDLAVQGLKTSLVSDLLPVLTDITNRIAYFVAFFSGRNANVSLSDMFAADDEEMRKTLIDIEASGAAAMSLADKLFSMGDTATMTADQYAIWKGTAKELISIVPELGDVIDVESGQINANSEEIKKNIEQWEMLAKQKALQTLKEKKYQQIVEKNQDLIDKAVEANKKAAAAEEAKVRAEHKFSDTMKEYGLGELDFTGDVEQQISDVMDYLADLGDAGEDAALALGLTLTEYGTASTEAAKARREADQLAEELKKGEAEYQEWVETAEEMYGIRKTEAQEGIDETDAYIRTLKKIPRNVHTVLERDYVDVQPRPFAIGTNYVPYDNYPALLHRGEQVLTATEVRRNNNQGQISTDFENRVIAAIREGMADANVTAIVTDRQVARGSNRFNGNELDSRRFVP